MESVKSPGFLLYLSYFYAYFLPMILYVLWTPLSIYELGQRNDLSYNKLMTWTMIIVLFPWVGSIAYFFSGLSGYSKRLRILLIIPGLVLTILFVLISTLTST
ncbi:MAG: hypothetical protein H7A24_10935 [Leptospiraceae bacterium]|nr:hypothetical protein [Leptospiraceae bacterium]MCP5512387.1 hypothetical protein [Leptospiraceae bacterium]